MLKYTAMVFLFLFLVSTGCLGNAEENYKIEPSNPHVDSGVWVEYKLTISRPQATIKPVISLSDNGIYSEYRDEVSVESIDLDDFGTLSEEDKVSKRFRAKGECSSGDYKKYTIYITITNALDSDFVVTREAGLTVNCR